MVSGKAGYPVKGPSQWWCSLLILVRCNLSLSAYSTHVPIQHILLCFTTLDSIPLWYWHARCGFVERRNGGGPTRRH